MGSPPESSATPEVASSISDELLAWLSKAASPEVRYLVARDFNLPAAGEVLSLWERVARSKVATRLLARQEINGAWRSGILDSAYSPKYVTTVWRLIKLGRLGFDASDPRIERAAEFALSFQTESGGFVRLRSYDRPGRFDPCDTATHLLALGSVGLGADQRVRKAAAELIARQRRDGGWIRPDCQRKRGSSASCAALTSTAARALDLLGAGGLEFAYAPAVKEALGFLLGHLSTLTPPERKRFLGRGHLLVAELLLFAKYGFPCRQAPLVDTVEWLENMFVPDERHFHYSGKAPSAFRFREDGGISARVARYHLVLQYEDDWLTYDMARFYRFSASRPAQARHGRESPESGGHASEVAEAVPKKEGGNRVW